MPRPGAPRIAAAAVALLLLLAPWATPRPAAAASPFVPLDHPAYAQVDAWMARGILPSTPLGARPYTWERLGAMLARARARDPVDRAALVALAREVRAHAGPGDDRHADLTFTGAYAEGQPVTYPNVAATTGGPLSAYDAGRGWPEHLGGEARLRAEGHWGRRFALDVVPRVKIGDATDGNPGWQEGYAALDLGPVAVSAGRQPLVWGPGHDGGFLLTDNAAPVPAVRMGLTSPHAFQGWWAWLGTWDFSYLLGRLEPDRVVPKPYLTGLRILWMPTARLELGAGRTILLGGEGRPGLSWTDYLAILGGRNIAHGPDNSDSIAGLDAAYTLPLPGGRAVRLYGEYAGEDEVHQSHLPIKPAVRGGLYLAGIGPGGRFTARAEFAATDVFYNHAVWGHDFWYAHSTYQSGYTYRGRILGDAMGADARTARLWIGRPGVRSEGEVMLGWYATRFSDPDREDHWQLGVRRTRPSGPFRATIDARLERVNYGDARADAWQSLLLITLSRPLPSRVESSPP
jgi:hypothetical protein